MAEPITIRINAETLELDALNRKIETLHERLQRVRQEREASGRAPNTLPPDSPFEALPGGGIRRKGYAPPPPPTPLPPTDIERAYRTPSPRLPNARPESVAPPLPAPPQPRPRRPLPPGIEFIPVPGAPGTAGTAGPGVPPTPPPPGVGGGAGGIAPPPGGAGAGGVAPPPGGAAGTGGGIARAAGLAVAAVREESTGFGSTFAAIRNTARTGLGIAAGIGIFHTLTQAIGDYENKVRGVLHVGLALGDNFIGIDKTVNQLRRDLYLLPAESLPALEAFGRQVGSVIGSDQIQGKSNQRPGFLEAMRAAQAYGLSPVAAGALQGELLNLTSGTADPLGLIAGRMGQGLGGRIPAMSEGRFAEQAAGIAAYGGTNFGQLPADLAANFASFFSTIGGPGPNRFNVNPAGEFAQTAGQLTQRGNPAIQAIKQIAIQDLATELPGGKLEIDGRTVDLRSYLGAEEAYELAPHSPQILAKYFQQAQRLGGDNEDVRRSIFRSISEEPSAVRSRSIYDAFARLDQEGGIAEVLGKRTSGPELAEIQRKVQENYEAAIKTTPGGGFIEAAAKQQEALEPVGRLFGEAQKELSLAFSGIAKAFQDGTVTVNTFIDNISKLTTGTTNLIGVLTLLSSNNTTQTVIGGGILGLGVLKGLSNGAPPDPGIAGGGTQPLTMWDRVEELERLRSQRSLPQ